MRTLRYFRLPMFTLPVLAALAAVALVTSFISGIFGMAGGMLLIGFLLLFLPVPVAMVFHGVIQITANGWRRRLRLVPCRAAPDLAGKQAMGLKAP